MASFPAEIVESSRQLHPIAFGEFTPDFLQAILEKETPSQPQPSGPPPISHQLWFSMMPKPPRKPPQLSRIVSPVAPRPRTLSQTTERSYVSVPSQWCIDNRVCSRATYLSRNPLLRKMFPRRLLYRKFMLYDELSHVNEENHESALEILGYPLDYWLCFPLKSPDHRPECAEPFPLEDEPLSPNQEIAHAWLLIEPDLYSSDTLDHLVNPGPQHLDALTFPWVTNASSTKMVSIRNMNSWGVKRINGFMECTKCGILMGLSFFMPRRFGYSLVNHVHNKDKIKSHGERLLRPSLFSCMCDGNSNKTRAVVSDDWSKINWLFVFLARQMGYFNRDQLRYFCSQTKLETSGNNKELLLRVCFNLCEQLYPGSSTDPGPFLRKIKDASWINYRDGVE